MKTDRPSLVLALVVLIAIIAAVFCIHPSRAHSPERPDLNEWFGTLQNGTGGYCCSGDDVDVIKDSDWRSADGHYQVFLEGEWQDVPDYKLVKGPNKFGRTLVWPIWINGKQTIRCFMPGPAV